MRCLSLSPEVRSYRNGLTLTELLVVILIIGLVIALLLPVVASARKRSLETRCMSNLRQIHVAFSAYVQDQLDNDPNNRPLYIYYALKPYIKSDEIWLCPLDRWGGSEGGYGNPREPFHSYRYIRGLDLHSNRLLMSADNNHGIFTCYHHGEVHNHGYTRAPNANFTRGFVMRLRLDGSVKKVRVPLLCDPNVNGAVSRPDWYLATEARPCPPEWCIFDYEVRGLVCDQ